MTYCTAYNTLICLYTHAAYYLKLQKRNKGMLNLH